MKLLAPGATMTITMKYTPMASRLVTVSATATERNLEPNSSNDTGIGVLSQGNFTHKR